MAIFHSLSGFIKSYWLAISIFNLILVTVLSLTPLENLPPAPGSDKTHHLIAYAVLVFPSVLARPSYLIPASLFCLAWGGAIELLQPYVNRYGEWLDLGANALGIAIGVASAKAIDYYFDPSRKEPEQG